MNQLRSIIKEHWIFVVLFLTCAALRFIPISDYQFTYDELANLDWAQASSFHELLETGVKKDTHPILVQTIVYAIEKCFGHPEWLVKLPFLLFSLGTILFAYLITWRYFSKQAALFATLFFCFSLIFVYYAPIARMYISGVFFSLGLLYYFFGIFFSDKNRTQDYFLFALFALLCAFNQHMNALFAFTVYVSGLLFRLPDRKKYILTGFCVVFVYLPHLPITLWQLRMAGIGPDQGGWLDKPYPDAFFTFTKVLLGTGKSYLLMGLLIGLSFIGRSFSLQKKQWLLLALFIVNYLVIYFYSIFRAPIFQNSVMLFAGSALLLFICSLINYKDQRFFYGALVVMLAALIYKSYFKKDYFRQAVRTVFDEQFRRTAGYRQKRASDVYAVFFDADSIMKTVYQEKYYAQWQYSSSYDSVCSSTKAFSALVKSLQCNELALAASTPIYQRIAAQYFPFLIENTQTQGIHYKVYSKIPPEKAVYEDPITDQSDARDWRSFTYGKLTGPLEAQRPQLLVDSLTEFPFDATAAYSDVIDFEGEMILVTVDLKSTKPLTALELCISVGDSQGSVSYNYTSKKSTDFMVTNDSLLRMYCQMYVGSNHRTIRNKARIACYLWNRGRENFKLLNFKIEVIDHWHQKWQYWD